MTSDLDRRMAGERVQARLAQHERRLVGYAAVFDSPTVIAGLFREQIARGAFRGAIGRDDVRCLFNHNSDLILGRTGAGTLTLREDDRGLRYEVNLPGTTWAADLWLSVKRGDVSQSSFAFTVDEPNGDEWTYHCNDGGLPLRTLRTLSLYDVSPVTYPAYAATTVGARGGLGAETAAFAGPGDRRAVAMARELVAMGTRAQKLRCDSCGDPVTTITALGAALTFRCTGCWASNRTMPIAIERHLQDERRRLQAAISRTT